MASTEQTTYHSVWTRQGPQTLTGDQDGIREEFKAHAATLFTGSRWTQAVHHLTATGLDPVAAEETLTDAVQELIEDGWSDYQP